MAKLNQSQTQFQFATAALAVSGCICLLGAVKPPYAAIQAPKASLPTHTVNAGSDAFTYRNLTIIGKPEHLFIMRQVLPALDRDPVAAPYIVDQSASIECVDSLFDKSGQKLAGLATPVSNKIKLVCNQSFAAGLTIHSIAGTTLHEVLHLHGLSHAAIYPMQRDFVARIGGNPDTVVRGK